MLFIHDIDALRTELTIASGGPPGGLPAATADPRQTPSPALPLDSRFFLFYFIPWKPTDTWPRDRCGRAQLVLFPSLVDFLHLGADL